MGIYCSIGKSLKKCFTLRSAVHLIVFWRRLQRWRYPRLLNWFSKVWPLRYSVFSMAFQRLSNKPKVPGPKPSFLSQAVRLWIFYEFLISIQRAEIVMVKLVLSEMIYLLCLTLCVRLTVHFYISMHCSSLFFVWLSSYAKNEKKIRKLVKIFERRQFFIYFWKNVCVNLVYLSKLCILLWRLCVLLLFFRAYFFG